MLSTSLATTAKSRSGLSSSGDLPEMLTARDLEAILKIDVKTIYGYVHRGLIPYVKIQSNVRFCKREILEWIDSRSHLIISGNGRGKS